MTRLVFLAVFTASYLLAGCKATELRRTGFLTDYDNLQQVDADLFFYRDPRFRKEAYPRVILDSIAVDLQVEDERRFSDEEIQEIVEYTSSALTRILSKHFELVSTPGPGTGRLRLALTDVARSKPLLNVLPHTRITGVGRGGAAAEGEYVDSITGVQIFAGIRRSTGAFLSTSGFSALSDIKAAIDVWAKGVDERCADWTNEG